MSGAKQLLKHKDYFKRPILLSEGIITGAEKEEMYQEFRKRFIRELMEDNKLRYLIRNISEESPYVSR